MKTTLRHLLPVLLLAAGVVPARAQQPTALDDVRREMQQMRQQYDQQLRRMQADYEARLQRVDARLKAAEGTAAKASETAASAQQTAAQAAAAPAAAAAQTPAALPADAGSSASQSAFNPSIGVILDGRFASISRNPSNYRLPGFMRGSDANLGDQGFALGESEVSFSSNIDHYLYGTAIISVERTGTVSVEEAYMQTTSLPYGFTGKAGRFFSGIGYMNEQHKHVWDFADAPLPYRAFLNNQLNDDGVQMRWLAPTDYFLEFGSEAARGDNFPAGNAADRGMGMYSAFVHVGDDLNESSSFRTGASFLRTRAANRVNDGDTFNGNDNTGIVDFVYKWAPDGNPVDTNVKVQGEYFVRRETGLFNGTNYDGVQTGFYLQSVYQFMPQWRVGARYDQVDSTAQINLANTVLDNRGITPRRYTAMTDYSTSEFGRFRLQYNRDQGQPASNNEIILQYTVSLGAHGAHAF